MKRKILNIHSVGIEWTGRWFPLKKSYGYLKPRAICNCKRELRNAFIAMISSRHLIETTDITAEKKIKDLTFHFCCVRKEWTMKTNNIKGNGDINVIF